jgi:hypothetical protein
VWAVKIAVTLAGAWVYFVSEAPFDALLAPATRDAIHFVLSVMWVAAMIMLGMIRRISIPRYIVGTCVGEDDIDILLWSEC